MRTFGAKLHNLSEIFANKNYTIPDFQRSYSWGKNQVTELISDIEQMEFLNKSDTHYTGTIVISSTSKNKFEIIDGQQRLTTLIIILNLISNYLPEHEALHIRNTYIIRGSKGNEEFVLKLNQETRGFFENVIIKNKNIKNNPVSIEAHTRLYNARDTISSWIKMLVNDKDRLKNIKTIIEQNLGFIVYAPANNSETGIMFEVINNRGLELTKLEKVKNYMIYCAVKLGAEQLRADINISWSKILKNLNHAKKTSDNDENSFLRYCVAVYFKLSKENSQYGYEEIKTIININESVKCKASADGIIDTIFGFIEFLEIASLWYDRLYGKNYDGLERSVIDIIELIRSQGSHASIMPLFLSIVIKSKNLDGKPLRLLRLLEILNFRVYMARGIVSRSDSGQADLFRLAAHFYHNTLFDITISDGWFNFKNSIKDEFEALECQLVNFILYYSNDSIFLNNFTLDKNDNYDFCEWGGLRYFLMNYEAKLQPNRTIDIDRILKSRSEGKSNDYLSVEHIWAKENRNIAGQNNRLVDIFERRRLGNFVLLELRINIQGSADDLDVKLNKYIKSENGDSTDLEHVKKMVSDAKKAIREKNNSSNKKSKNYYTSIHQALNDAQEARYINFAGTRWGLNEFFGYKEISKY